MRFPNAYAGVKKVFIAQILSLIAAIIVIPGSALATMGSVSVFGGGGTGMIVGGLILSLIGALILPLISVIMTIVGLAQASKDEEKFFRTAFIVSIIQLVISIIIGVYSARTAGVVGAPAGLKLISGILNLLLTIFIISGITEQARRLGNDSMFAKGKRVLILCVILQVISLILNLVSSNSVMLVLGGIALILSIVFYICYLVYLGKAVTMLQNS